VISEKREEAEADDKLGMPATPGTADGEKGSVVGRTSTPMLLQTVSKAREFVMRLGFLSLLTNHFSTDY
jgi:hypothetical protein